MGAQPPVADAGLPQKYAHGGIRPSSARQIKVIQQILDPINDAIGTERSDRPMRVSVADGDHRAPRRAGSTDVGTAVSNDKRVLGSRTELGQSREQHVGRRLAGQVIACTDNG